jgi:DNA-binding NarL/FixJ family response regulator
LLGDQAAQSDSRVRVCIADEDELFLAGCTHLLGSTPGMGVVRSTSTRYAAEEMDALFGLKPDVLVLGIDRLERSTIECPLPTLRPARRPNSC